MLFIKLVDIIKYFKISKGTDMNAQAILIKINTKDFTVLI